MTSQQQPSPRVVSVNVGRARTVGAGRTAQVSAIDKRPVAAIEVRDPGDLLTGVGSGVEGDEIWDRAHHGGSRQAVYVVAREQLEHWQRELGRDLDSGTFGENLTTQGIDVDGAVVGTTWRVGEEAELEVCGPRTPCATFAAHLGEPGWVRRFTEHGHPGTYCSVRRPGRVRAGDGVWAESVPDHGVTVRTVFAAHSGDLSAAHQVLDARCLPPEEHAFLAERVARRENASARVRP
ncbi:MAG: MOSC domain-containing protein [Ornithinimicrobium sp.]